MLTNTKGFTLMEILVVVTIIGILAAIAVPSYIYAVEKGREDACAANIQILITQVERYRLEEGKTIPEDLDGKYSLVDFLTDKGYLIDQQIKCPLGGKYSLATETKTVGTEVITVQTVECDHADSPDTGNGS